jgi:hypothetical protein
MKMVKDISNFYFQDIKGQTKVSKKGMTMKTFVEDMYYTLRYEMKQYQPNVLEALQ